MFFNNEKLDNKIFQKLTDYNSRKKELEQSINNGTFDIKILKELGKLTKILENFEALQSLIQEIKSLEDIEDDLDLQDLIKHERENLDFRIIETRDKLLGELFLDNETSDCNAIIEIRAAAGGDESCLFAQDLFKIYAKWAEQHNYKYELMSISEGTTCGYKEISFNMKGKDIFQKLQYESGVHRVQRVPETETKGRIHTSTCTVSVLPEVSEVEVDLKQSDYRKDTYRASGAGGQHVNKTESAIRLTHHETGIVVCFQSGRSQHKNLEEALKILRARLYNYYREQQMSERSADRKNQIGSGERSEKIRTYNYPQNRITDHRTKENYSLEQILSGNLNQIFQDLTNFDLHEKIKVL